MPGNCAFNDLWLQSPQYSKWLQRHNDKRKAYCFLCCKSFSISAMGEAAVKSHMVGKKHCTIRKSSENTPGVQNLFGNRTLPCAAVATIVTAKMDKVPVPVTVSSEGDIVRPRPNPTLNVSRNDCLHAEILWAIKVVDSHLSYMGNLLQRMFPDSEIVKQFTCGQKKCAYMCSFGIAPYFLSLLKRNVREQENYVLLFDESLNKHLQLKQLDFHVRLWENDRVISKYLHSEFMGHATANHLHEKFIETMDEIGLPHEKLLQLSMDGPNVNWKFYDSFHSELKNDTNCSLLNTGSCGLHIVNGAFKTGAKASDWDVESIFSSAYTLFKNSPARREDFVAVSGTTGGNVFPLKFCSVRWLENDSVAERIVELLPAITNYVAAVKNKKVPDPNNKSFATLKLACTDPLTVVKILSFQSISKLIKPFMINFQSDKPMLPFVCTEMFNLMKCLMTRILKTEVMQQCTSMKNLLQVDVRDSANHAETSRIDMGFSTEKVIKELKTSGKVSDKQIFLVRMECKKFLIECISKLMKKSPITFSLVRSLSCLDPRQMHKKEDCIKKMKQILNTLVQAGRVREQNCDEILSQFSSVLDEVVHVPEFKDFNPKMLRLDCLFHEYLSQKSEYQHLWKVIKMLLLLSHGQATVERGFSINREIEIENLKKESLVSLRIIKDHIESVGGIQNIIVTKELLMSAASARQRYTQHLEEQKRTKDRQEKNNKRKKEYEEIHDLKEKKRRLELDVASLTKSADQFSEKAERTSQLTFVAKANSFRRSAKEKMSAISSIEREIELKIQCLTG